MPTLAPASAYPRDPLNHEKQNIQDAIKYLEEHGFDTTNIKEFLKAKKIKVDPEMEGHVRGVTPGLGGGGGFHLNPEVVAGPLGDSEFESLSEKWKNDDISEEDYWRYIIQLAGTLVHEKVHVHQAWYYKSLSYWTFVFCDPMWVEVDAWREVFRVIEESLWKELDDGDYIFGGPKLEAKKKYLRLNLIDFHLNDYSKISQEEKDEIYEKYVKMMDEIDEWFLHPLEVSSEPNYWKTIRENYHPSYPITQTSTPSVITYGIPAEAPPLDEALNQNGWSTMGPTWNELTSDKNLIVNLWWPESFAFVDVFVKTEGAKVIMVEILSHDSLLTGKTDFNDMPIVDGKIDNHIVTSGDTIFDIVTSDDPPSKFDDYYSKGAIVFTSPEDSDIYKKALASDYLQEHIKNQQNDISNLLEEIDTITDVEELMDGINNLQFQMYILIPVIIGLIVSNFVIYSRSRK